MPPMPSMPRSEGGSSGLSQAVAVNSCDGLYRPKGVFGKGVGNSKNAPETRQKCVRNASKMRQNGSCFIGKRGTFQNASKLRQKCAEHLGGEHLLDDTDA